MSASDAPAGASERADGSADADERVLQFSRHMGALKHLQRTGWLRKQVPNPESVAAHMYRMSMLAAVLSSDASVDRDRCVRMCLAHDMAECIVGDLTPHCGVSEESKHDKEKEAMGRLCALLPDKSAADDFMHLWLEYERNETAEAKFVHDLDKFDMIHQAYEYEQREGRPNGLQEFFDSTKDVFQTDRVKSLVECLRTKRDH